MLRRLFTPRWLGALLLAALFSVASYHLGWWQYHRHEAKSERNARLDAHYRADPVPVPSVLTPAGLPLADEWTRVQVTGSYGGGPVFVRNRTLDSRAGYEVLWVLRPDAGGPDVVVDRGWVPVSERGASTLPAVPSAPTGEVVVTGWVRRGEASRGRDLPDGQVASINLREVGTVLGSPGVLPGYVQLESERLPDGTTPPRPTPLGEPDRSLGPHLAYAYQWWLATVLGFVLVWFGIRRELRLEDPVRYPSTPKKTRIWDEEDE
ncbi:SURF1 family protein [Oryzobacter telluris]|uniref:SURF1 family cytochrome oxidase biogenesis protein n=1 Tax=Oryzobacter telluris TaxID=3149179 RepID=UPI00370DC08F